MKEKNKGGRPKLYESAEELQTLVDDYFESDEAFTVSYVNGDEVRSFTPTMSGLALYLGMTRQSLVNYSREEEFFDTIKKARSKIESCIEKKLYGNNVTGLIFNLKNNFDWKDKSEVQQTNVELTHDEWIESLE